MENKVVYNEEELYKNLTIEDFSIARQEGNIMVKRKN